MQHPVNTHKEDFLEFGISVKDHHLDAFYFK